MAKSKASKTKAKPSEFERKRLSQHELDEVMERHQRFLDNAENGQRAMLKMMDLSYLDMSNRVLRTADFTGAKLKGVQMLGVNLESATLYGADLTEANMQRAILDRSD
ncbi:MAG: pentapeptide repeat-containing protein, partial [Rhodospirillaceae bacterium]|nr:pentapeptide repeat-containing protein [Rhodospirillaceae bacterium]